MSLRDNVVGMEEGKLWERICDQILEPREWAEYEEEKINSLTKWTVEDNQGNLHTVEETEDSDIVLIDGKEYVLEN